VIISCRGFKSSINTGLLISGFFAFVVIRMNFRCLANAWYTLEACTFH
jgi:hypothetical protein